MKLPEVYLGICGDVFFTKIVNGFFAFNYFCKKNSILDVWQGPRCVSGYYKK